MWLVNILSNHTFSYTIYKYSDPIFTFDTTFRKQMVHKFSQLLSIYNLNLVIFKLLNLYYLK